MDKALKIIAIVIPSIGAILYFFGVVFDEGYYRFWHLDSTLFPNSVHETIVRGVLGIVQVGAKNLSFIALVPLGALGLTLLLKRPLALIESKLVGNSNAKTPLDKTDPLHHPLMALASLALASLLYVFATILIAVLAWNISAAGKDIAKNQLETFNSSEPSKQYFKTLTLELKKTPGNPIKTEIIRCNSIRCAFYIDKSVYVIDTDQIKTIKTYQ